MALIKTLLGSGSTIEQSCFNSYENVNPYYLTSAFTSTINSTIEVELFLDENGTQHASAGYYSNGDITRYYDSFSALCESNECVKSEYLLGCCDNKVYKLKSGKSLLIGILVSIKPIYYCYRVISPPTWFPKYEILNDDIGYRIYSGSSSCDIMECQPCETYTAETINTCEPITLLPLQLNCEVVNPTEIEPLSGVLDVAVVGGTQPYQITWTLPDGTVLTASTVYNQPEGTYTVTVSDRYGDFTASTQCSLEINYDCTFSGSAEEFTPIETSKCYSPSGISGCSGLIGSNNSGIDPTYTSFTVIVCDCPQIYSSGSDCECYCANSAQTQVYATFGTSSPIGSILYTSPSLSATTIFTKYFIPVSGSSVGNYIYGPTSITPYCTIGSILSCLSCGSGSSGSSGTSGISGTICTTISSRNIYMATYQWVVQSNGTCRFVATQGAYIEVYWCNTGVNSGPGYGPIYTDLSLSTLFNGNYFYGSGNVYNQNGYAVTYIASQNEIRACNPGDPSVARVRPTIPITPTPIPSPTPTPTLPICTVSLQFLKNCWCSRTSGIVLVDGVTAYTWNDTTVTSFTSVTASYGQTITIQGNVLTPANGCSYFYSKLGVSVTEDLSVTYNSSIITGQNLISYSFPIITCNTVLTINSSCQ